jgi:cupin 2 domain-containing protein
MKNIFDPLPPPQADEVFDTLLEVPGLRIERIVSHGQASPQGCWYNQPHDEWILVLRGAARLQYEGEPQALSLRAGDYHHIPAGLRHRVEWTSPDEPTIWLALHFEHAP